MRRRSSSVAAPVVTRLLAAAEKRGADAASMLAVAGLKPDDVARLEDRVPLDAIRVLFAEAERQTGDSAFGLHMAELSRSRPDPLVALAIASSATMGDVYRSIARYAGFVNESVEIKIEIEGDSCALIHLQHDPVPAGRHGVECSLAMLFLCGRQTLGDAFRVEGVSFRHDAPSSTAEHARIFGAEAELAFGRERDAIVFARALLDMPLPSANERIRWHVTGMLDEMLLALPGKGGLAHRVRESLRAELQRDATLEGVAARLGVSPRSLQRQLQSDGESFRQVLDDLRRELAVRYLRRRDLALDEIGSRLGFAEQSAFQRAFRRWLGTSPAEWRRRSDNDER
jgi:AraC-like DNA-binding protein